MRQTHQTQILLEKKNHLLQNEVDLEMLNGKEMQKKEKKEFLTKMVGRAAKRMRMRSMRLFYWGLGHMGYVALMRTGVGGHALQHGSAPGPLVPTFH